MDVGKGSKCARRIGVAVDICVMAVAHLRVWLPFSGRSSGSSRTTGPPGEWGRVRRSGIWGRTTRSRFRKDVSRTFESLWVDRMMFPDPPGQAPGGANRGPRPSQKNTASSMGLASGDANRLQSARWARLYSSHSANSLGDDLESGICTGIPQPQAGIQRRLLGEPASRNGWARVLHRSRITKDCNAAWTGSEGNTITPVPSSKARAAGGEAAVDSRALWTCLRRRFRNHHERKCRTPTLRLGDVRSSGESSLEVVYK